MFDADVTALSASEWSTDLTVSGTYDGPTDIVSVRDYEIDWTASGKTLVEKGRATLVSSSGRSVRSEWSSTIVAKDQSFRGSLRRARSCASRSPPSSSRKARRATRGKGR